MRFSGIVVAAVGLVALTKVIESTGVPLNFWQTFFGFFGVFMVFGGMRMIADADRRRNSR